jgi:hypothetical protein
MNDDSLRQRLHRIQGGEPSPEFVEQLRRRLSEGEEPTSPVGPQNSSVDGDGTVIEIDLNHPPGAQRRPRGLWAAAAAVLVIGIPLMISAIAGTGTDREVGTAATTEVHRVGEAWIRSVIDDDRAAFVALHAPGFESDDTLMGFSEDVGLLTPNRVSEIYFGGFDAFQAARRIDGDAVRSNGCEDVDGDTVQCGFTSTMIGTDDYTYTVLVELVVEDELITSVDFSVTTEPADFRLFVEDFFDDEATDDDRACLALGFNTVGCGEHESDFVTRYAAYYEAKRQPPGG